MSHFPLNVLTALLQLTSREPRAPGRAAPTPIAWTSTKGPVRNENQDRLIVARSSDIVLAVLADGMGGMREGAQAASIAVSATAAWCMLSSQDAPLDVRLVRALRYANDEVFKLLQGEGGAAVVAAARQDKVWWVAHAGDARAYHLRDNDLEQLTVDDTVKGQLGQLGLAPAPNLETGLLQFIGIGADLEPHVRTVPAGGRALLLTSDGVHSLPEQIFESVTRNAKALQAATERLVSMSEWHGGHDNASAVALGLANGYSEGHISGLTEFWVPGVERPVEHLFVIADRTPVDTKTSIGTALAAEAPAPAASMLEPLSAPLPQARVAESAASAAGPTKKTRSGRKRSKAVAARTKRSEKTPRNRLLPELPMVTVDVDGEEDTSPDDKRASKTSRSSIFGRSWPKNRTR